MVNKLLEEILSSTTDGANDGVTFEAEDLKLAPLLPEINLITDDHVRQYVRAILVQLEHFWKAPASLVESLHPPDEYGPGGLILHTRRVVRAVWLLAESQQRTLEELNILLAAAILHDVTKAMITQQGEVIMDPMHPYTVDQLAHRISIRDAHDPSNLTRSTTLHLQDDPSYILQILRLIRCHEGIFSPIPETMPLTSLEWIIHLGNQVASNLHHLIDGDDVLAWRWNDSIKNGPKKNVRSK